MRPILLALFTGICIIITACNPTTMQTGAVAPTLTDTPTVAPIIITPPQLSQDQLVQHIQQSTVALVVSSDGTGHIYKPYCTGVWVGPTAILTAAHCVEDENDTAADIIGQEIHYIGRQDVRGQEVEPGAIHTASIVKHDHKHDLVLLAAVGNPGSIPAHQIAVLTAVNIPPMGSTLHTMGQTIGLYWSYCRGYVAGYRLALPDMFDDWAPGPYLQVSIPIWHGNSGGGLFNDAGELVAIVHTVSTEAPLVSFNVPPITIRRFLTGKP